MKLRLEHYVGLCFMLAGGACVAGTWFRIPLLRDFGLGIMCFILAMLLFCVIIVLLMERK